MSLKLLVIFVTLGFCGVSSAQEEVYRGTDETGAPSFSDVPQGNAEKYELPKVNLMPSPKPIDLSPRFNDTSLKVKYRTLEITSPIHDSTVLINTTNMRISANVVPPARRDLGHTLQITMDGEVLVENQTSFTLDNADRGSHEIRVRIVAADGSVFASSEPVVVHIRKPTIR